MPTHCHGLDFAKSYSIPCRAFSTISHAPYVILYFFRFMISCLHHGLYSFVPHLSLLYLFCSPLSFLSTCLFTGRAVKLDLPHFLFPRASSFGARVIITLELRPFVLHVVSYLFCIPSFCRTHYCCAVFPRQS